jgi:hypothetical protein
MGERHSVELNVPLKKKNDEFGHSPNIKKRFIVEEKKYVSNELYQT